MRTGTFICGLSTLLASSHLPAQAVKSAEDDLLALLNTPITVASQKAMTTREAPGIVTLVTREEILASGARDLLDVLRLVPGFDFASDIQGTVGPAVRGNWAFEGKLLLLVDGQELNETRYGTSQFGNHVPVAQIRQVEIIRGPGSAIYGGYAELAVVNVITRDGANLRGVSGGFSYGKTANSTTQRVANLAYGNVAGALTYSFSASVGDGQRSEERWNSFGDVRDLKDNSKLRMSFLNLGMAYKGLTLRIIRDAYEPDDFTFYRRSDQVSPMRFAGTYAEAKYTFEVDKTFKLVPRLTFKTQEPWYYPDALEGGKRKSDRTTFGIQGIWDPNPNLDLIFGVDAWKDEGKTPAGQPWSNGSTTVSYTSQAYFAQALLSTSLANVTVGARFDKNSQFGSSFVPRFALTRAWDVFHVKLLASKAFRAPAIENIELNPLVKPEKTTALEVEFGAQLGRGFVSLNLFDISIKDPIIYRYNVITDEEAYLNLEKTGTRGVELDFQLRGDWGFLHSTLTMSKAQDNQVSDFTVPGESGYMVAMPNVKATLLASFKLGGGWSFAPSLVALGPRYTFESAGGPVKRDSAALLNAFLHYTLVDRKLSFSAGVHNLTGTNIGFPKAYQGTDGDTYPSQARDFFIRAAYNF